jgi:hypothetical protein
VPGSSHLLAAPSSDQLVEHFLFFATTRLAESRTFFSCFLRRLERMKKSSPATAIRQAMPPTTPPAIVLAPTWPGCGLGFEATNGYVEDEAVPHAVLIFVTVCEKMGCKAVWLKLRPGSGVFLAPLEFHLL